MTHLTPEQKGTDMNDMKRLVDPTLKHHSNSNISRILGSRRVPPQRESKPKGVPVATPPCLLHCSRFLPCANAARVKRARARRSRVLPGTGHRPDRPSAAQTRRRLCAQRSCQATGRGAGSMAQRQMRFGREWDQLRGGQLDCLATPCFKHLSPFSHSVRPVILNSL